MEDNNSPIYIIENQNEENVDQILDINNDNLSDRNDQNESIQNINITDSPNISLNKEKNIKPKGYVRILRNIFKKKDDLRKKLLKDYFLNWYKDTLKGLTIQKKIFVRLSVSKGKDDKNRNRKNSDFNEEFEKEQSSRSVNKRQIKMKEFNKPPAIPQTIYNIRREKIENLDNIENIENFDNNKNFDVSSINDKENINQDSLKLNKNRIGNSIDMSNSQVYDQKNKNCELNLSSSNQNSED